MTLQCHTLIQALLGSFFLSNPYEGVVNTSFYTLVVSLYFTVVVLWLYQYYGILSSLFSSKNEIHPATLYSCSSHTKCFLGMLVCDTEAVDTWDLPAVPPKGWSRQE